MPRRSRPAADAPAAGPPASRGGRSQVETLLRILDLEASRDFGDAAVAGGLDRFLDIQRERLRGLPMPGRPYADLSPPDRRAWAESVRNAAGAPPGQPARPASPRTAAAKTPAPRSRPKTSSGRPKPGRKPPATAPPPTLDTPIEDLAFLPKTAPSKLRRLGIGTLRDLLWHFPRRHIDYSNVARVAELEVDRDTTVIVRVLSATTARIGRPPGAAKVTASDGTGIVELTWFGQAYLAQRFKRGTQLVISGRPAEFRGKAQFENPEYEVLAGGSRLHAGNLLPVYPGTERLAQRTLRNAVRNALDAGLPLVEEHLPARLRDRHALPGLAEAITSMHLPETPADRERAHRRLAFDELFVNQLGVQRRKREWRTRGGGVAIAARPGVLDSFLGSLDFTLTSDQRESLDAILSDMALAVPMGRLLQGEVGSGKTVVAVAALLAAVADGHQGVLLAPTEVLAEQHFLSLRHLLDARPAGSPAAGEAGAMTQGALMGEDATSVARPVPRRGRGPAPPLLVASVSGFDRPLTIGLLLGSLTARQKAGARELIASGRVDIAVGTHALIQEDVRFHRLGLAVVDEQHRFGVEQRAALTRTTPRPHLLAMSATPIPRSLALTLYGDLDLSTLRQLPGGRKPVTTAWARGERQRVAAYELVRTEVAAGRQAFVVCPLIDESEAVQTRSAVEEFEHLRLGVFADLRLGLLHGRMPLAEKQAVMERFRSGEVAVLVATPVIEVGIDIPNATVMVIEGAERFGLSQMHQLRGRVGRGEHQSHCRLLSDEPSQEARARLSVLERVADGFELAEEDLRLRGPGDYVGTRQSGFADLRVATLQDVDLLATARAEAVRLIDSDPSLAAPEHAALAREVDRALKDRPAEFS